MAKKRITLPKNFREMIKEGDIDALKAVYDKCELHAYDNRYSMNTALHFYGVPDELVCWLVQQGLDINIENYYGRTPLYVQATIGSDTVKLLLDLGANIQKPDRYGSSPLHNAANFCRTDTVRLLVTYGADIHAENNSMQTPLSSALARCQNINISNMAKIAALLLDAGAKITPDMLESVQRIGEKFEFHRDAFNKDYLVETDMGLIQLYSLFGVKPVAKRNMHDGVSPINVTGYSWKEQYNHLWDWLIPSSGAAKTIQGEVIRITGRVRDELYRNGGANWDKDYRKMLNALLNHFSSGVALSEFEIEEAKSLTSKIHAKGDDDDSITDRLCELAVVWVLKNPNPVPLRHPDYNR